jgi:TonB family protein
MPSYLSAPNFLSLLLLASLSATALSQTASPDPRPQAAVDLVAKQYSPNANRKVPSTKNPLPTSGTWAVTSHDDGLTFPSACSAPASCVQVLYREPTSAIVCRWTVLLQQGSGEPLIIDQDASTTQYMLWRPESNKPSPSPFAATPVQFVSTPPADIPPIARAAHIEGPVTVSMVIDAKGNIERADVVSGPPMLSRAALDAAKRYVFKPATLAGKPIVARVTFVVSLN